MQLAPGARLRSFEVLGPLGAGGMGSVYRARDEKLGRDVAIKILQERLAGSAEHLERFKREARAASALNHPNIITIFEIDEVQGAPFLAMELVEGPSLRKVLQGGRLPNRKLLDIATQIADGLAAAHERGIVHRDLKPENVMITGDGRVKIVDFGLAQIQERITESDSTTSLIGPLGGAGPLAGTAAYMSPEQAGGAAHVDFRSDQFSFGSILYELATGRRAFQRESAIETLAGILRDEPEPVHRVNPSLPVPVRWVIDRCLAKDPAQRYVSTRDLARELYTIRERLPDTWSGAGKIPFRSRRSIVAVAIALALMVGGAWLFPWSHRPEQVASATAEEKHLAVLPFKDETARPDGELFSMGLAESVRERLAKYSGFHVVYPTFSVSPISGGASLRKIAQQLGATLLLSATVHRAGDQVRVTYSLVDVAREKKIATRVVAGSVGQLWTLRNQIADHVAQDLGSIEKQPPAQHAVLESEEEQEVYIRAVGALDRVYDGEATDAAISGLHSLLETAPDSPLVHAALGRAYYNKYVATYDRQWSEKALRASRRAVEIDPETPETLITLGTVESIHGNYEESIAAYRRALALRPTSAVATIGLAQTLNAANRYEEAERMLRRGISLNPRWWFGHNELGSLYWHRAQYDDALREFREVIRLDPEGSWGYTNTGAVLLTKGRLDEAAAMFRKAISLGDDAGAYVNLGYCQFFRGRYDEAVESNRTAVSLRGEYSTYWIELGDACSWSSKYKGDARTAYETALKRASVELETNPRNARAHSAMAIALARTGDLENARGAIRRAMEFDPENPEHLFRAARIENLAGDREESVSWLSRALDAGTSPLELERHPEFAQLRETPAVRELLKTHSRT